VGESAFVTDRIARAVFGLLFETSTEAVFIVALDTGVIVSANLRAADLFGADPDALIGMALSECAAEPDRDLLSSGHYEEVALRRADGYPVYVELDVVHVETEADGALAAYMARDTSERRILQRELLAKHTALYQTHAELQRAHADLAAAKRELESRNEHIAMLAWRAALGELVAGIAHHLNNPVGALASTLHRMKTAVDAIPSDQRGDLDRLVGRVAQISRRIEFNVTAIVSATRTHNPSPGPTELPPELAAALSSFADKLDEIPTKDRS
jgi:PAS domain S-box-containing protein